MVEYPKEPGTLSQSQSVKFKRFIDTITGEIVQLGLIDTGNVTPDGVKIYALDVSGSQLSIIAEGNLKPDGYTNVVLSAADYLPPTSQALIVIIQNRLTSTGNVKVCGGITLSPGETIAVETVPNAEWIFIEPEVSTTADITILTNSTL